MMTQRTHDNHFVPQSYLKAWGNDSKRLWVYRLLVPNAGVPEWKLSSIRSVGRHRHLYTRLAAGEETDEIERWLEREFETPAQEALDRVRRDKNLTRAHWRLLARFVAAQHVRTPARFHERMQRWDDDLPATIEATLRSVSRRLEVAQREGKPVETTSRPDADYIPFRLFTRRSNEGGPEIGCEVVAGRSLWLFSIRHLLSKTLRVLERHRWTVLHAPRGVKWLTSDDPVITLNFESPERYDFRGGWGSTGTEILLPLSPRHMLYTRVGHRDRPERDAPAWMAELIQGFTVEHAYRAVYAAEPTDVVPTIRPRLVDREAYEREARRWRTWHEEQVRAEAELFSAS